MNLIYIEKMTELTIIPSKYQSLSANENSVEREYNALFYDILGSTSFFAESRELYESYESFTADTYLKVRFMHANNLYMFSGKAVNALVRNGVFLTQISQISSIEITTRRIFPRYEMSIAVKVYKKLPDKNLDPDNCIMSAVTFDISAEGMCVLSNDQLKIKDSSHLLVDFTLNKHDRFLLTAIIVRYGDCHQTVQFKYDYGFLFLYDDDPEDKNRIIMSLFKTKLGTMKRY